MNFYSTCWRALLVTLACVLTACKPPAPGTLDEHKDPHYLRGQDMMTRLDYRGAIESFEKALENNPRSAAAHFELGFLFDQKENDPAAAIYHFERFLRLRPNSERAEIVRQHITGCKMELAKTFLISPGGPGGQRELDKLKAEIERLTLENTQLRRPAETAAVPPRPAVTSAAPPPIKTVPTPLAPNVATAEAAKKVAATAPAPVPTATPKTHSIKQGETPVIVAKQYGLKVETLMAANPGVDPRKLKIGQVLNIPAP